MQRLKSREPSKPPAIWLELLSDSWYRYLNSYAVQALHLKFAIHAYEAWSVNTPVR